MELEKLPFKIGMHYENWEFDLEPIESSWEYDKYLYIGNEINEVLEEELDKVHLFFKWDILYEVVLNFKPIKTTQLFNNLSLKLEKNLGEVPITSNSNISVLEKEWKMPDLIIKLSWTVDANLVQMNIFASIKA